MTRISKWSNKVDLHIDCGPYQLKMAQTKAEVLQCFKLRHDVFCRELAGRSTKTGLDYDQFDSLCDHLIIVHQPTKKIVGTYRINFSQDPSRLYTESEFEMKELGVLDEYEPFIRGIRQQKEELLLSKWKRVYMAEKFGDLILSQPGYGQMQTRPYMRANIPLELERYRHIVPRRERLVIIHAPSNPLTKGSDYIQEVMDELYKEGLDFEFQLIQNLPNNELLPILSNADIVIDELYGDTIGMFSHEAMATGNLVLTHYPATFAKIPPDCPAVNITRENLREQVRRAIVDIHWRSELSYRGRLFVEKHCNYIDIAKQMLDWLQPGGISQYDFVPEEINSPNLRQLINNKINSK